MRALNPRSGLLLWSVMALVAIGAALLAWQGWLRHQAQQAEQARQTQAQQGQALFMGLTPLTGRMAGHDMDLPAEAVRCINCHGDQASERPVLAAASAASAPLRFAPRLDAQGLATLQRRRGGPPSQYDAASLCVLLRSGLDPAHVLVPLAMPRYTVTDAQCEALWQHLLTRP